MKLLDVESVENPVNTKKFSVLNEHELPYVFLGAELRNEYDQQRFLFNKENNIRDIVHFSSKISPQAKFYRGVSLKVNFDITKLIQKINVHKESFSNKITPVMYKTILKDFNLKCENSISHLDEDVYPIDGECIEQVTDENISLKDQYEFMFKNKKIPFYQSVGYLSIFIINSSYTVNKKVLKNFLSFKKSSV